MLPGLVSFMRNLDDEVVEPDTNSSTKQNWHQVISLKVMIELQIQHDLAEEESGGPHHPPLPRIRIQISRGQGGLNLVLKLSPI